MQSALTNFHIDTENLIDDLLESWKDNKNSENNPTAFSKKKIRGTNMFVCCPYHCEENPSFNISLESPYPFFCFSCGASGDVSKLVKDVLGIEKEIQVQRYLIQNYYNMNLARRPQIKLIDIFDNALSDKECSLLESELTKYSGKIHDYWLTARGFNTDTIARYELGYDSYENAVTVPIRTTDGKLRFIQKRAVGTKQFLNKSNILKRDIVFGLYNLINDFGKGKVKDIFLCESATDAIASHQGGLHSGAILGRVLFKEQVLQLLQAGVKKVTFFFDNDKHGMDCNFKSYEVIKKYPIRVDVVIYPYQQFGLTTFDESSIICKDANDLLKMNLLHKIEVVSYDEFLQKMYSVKGDL